MMWGKIKKVLGFLTDVLMAGRERGWWERKPGISLGLDRTEDKK